MSRPAKYTGPERRRTPRWRPRPLRVLFALLLVAVIGYAAAVLVLIAQETRLVFEAGSTLAPGRPPFPHEALDVPRADGIRQFAWSIPAAQPGTGGWILYLHGSATTVASQVNISHYALFRRVGFNVLAPEYQGFGGLPGRPTEASLQADAAAAYDYLRNTRKVPPESILLYGWSLGAAIAVDLAFRVPPAGLVLEGAPASLVDLTARRYPFFPMRLLMRSDFDPIRRIGRIPAPVLVIHGIRDEVIPLAEGRRLYESARGARMFVEVEGTHMTTIEQGAAAIEAGIRSFVDRYVPGVRAPVRQGGPGAALPHLR